jgi:hypothetical protein
MTPFRHYPLSEDSCRETALRCESDAKCEKVQLVILFYLADILVVDVIVDIAVSHPAKGEAVLERRN